jgi:predicted nucleic-acid-binding protein
MIGLDTNVLARYYVDDAGDAEAKRQRLAARRLIDSGQALMVSKTQPEVGSVLRHLLGLTHVTVEGREAVEQALANSEAGLDFADALHHASYRACISVATFDDRRFARRAKRLGMAPTVTVLA